jgi:SAM-dependent methyltransferase
MTQSPTPDFAQIKARMKSVWMAGDFGKVANYIADNAEEFVARTMIKPGSRVLDVACGTGNAAIPAARAGGVVTGVDIATNSLGQARKRAAEQNLQIRFDEGDVEELPYKDQEFDIVMSMFGAMFAPRPERVVSELIRVCKPGGQIAMANWTPTGFVGKSFQVTSRMVPPPPGIPAPVLWGDEDTVRGRFSHGVADLRLTREIIVFKYPFGPKEVVDFFRENFGPTKTSFSRLEKPDQDVMATKLEELWAAHNRAANGRTEVDAEYLDVRAVKA